MKEVVILTLQGMNNYGNRLQNYAMQQLFINYGCSVKTIKIKNEDHKKIIKEMLRLAYWRLNSKKRKRIKRRNKFYEFEKLINSDVLRMRDIHDGALNNYDYIVYGSDQIWNTEFDTFSKLFLGYYADREKNIAVSASFGTDDIAEEYRELFKEGLNNFKAISVREETGKRIIEKYTGIQCEVVPDPTLTLTKEEWIKVERKVSTPEEYVFTYFLGEMNIDFGDNAVIHGERGSEYGPGEFLYLIHNAKAVYTDSFHASVFSIIFEVPFYIYNRKGRYSSMSSRLRTLFDQFGFTYDESAEYCHVTIDEIARAGVRERIKELTGMMEVFLIQNLEIGENHED